VGLLNSNIVNLERGVMERVFYCKDNGRDFAPPTEPAHQLFRDRMTLFKARVKKNLPSTTPLTDEQFVDCYKGRKKATYQRAIESLRIKSVCRQDAMLTTFVKGERYDMEAKPDPTPRVIQPRDPRYNVEVGRYLKPMEHPLYQAIDRVFGYTTVTKGMNMVQVAQLIRDHWDSFDDPVAVLADANRFDQHVHETALRWEHSVYLGAVSPNDRTVLGRLLSWQLVNIARARCGDGSLKYKVRGRRMSGDMNTAMGNVLIMTGLVWQYVRSRNVRIRLVNNGDDSVFIMERKDLHLFLDGLEAWFLEMGFSMAVSPPISDIMQVKFCQAHPIFDGVDWIMTRDPRVALAKDCHSLVAWDRPGTQRAWCAAVANSGKALAGNLPIYSSFYQHLLRGSDGAKAHGDHPGLECGMWFEARRMGDVARSFAKPSAESRLSFWRAFGITPGEQACIERYYDGLPTMNYSLVSSEAVPSDPEYVTGSVDLPF
jgi:hypothetical protein